MRRLGAAGAALIKSFEKLALVGYLDEGNVPTIGWGHTGSGIAVGMLCDEDEAEAWFEQDTEHAENVVDATAPLSCTQNQFDALVSFAYNVGVGAYLHSTLLTLLKSDDPSGVPDQFLLWDHVNGVVSAGLLRRREAERALYLST